MITDDFLVFIIFNFWLCKNNNFLLEIPNFTYFCKKNFLYETIAVFSVFFSPVSGCLSDKDRDKY